MLSRVAHDSEVLHGFMHQLTGGFLLQSLNWSAWGPCSFGSIRNWHFTP